MKTRTMMEIFSAARRAGTPLVAIKCFDPEALMVELVRNSNDAGDSAPIIQWDIIRGWIARNDLGKSAITTALGGQPNEATINPIQMLQFANDLPESSILMMLNTQHHLDRMGKPADPEFVQAIWNLRDEFKSNLRTLVMLAPNVEFPPELQQDVLILDEELPSDDQLKEIINSVTSDAEIEVEPPIIEAAVDALRGIAAFPAEQAVAMCLTKKNGLNIEQLWERKRQLINNTPGLQVWLDGHKFDDLGGLDEIKSRFNRILKGKRAPRVTVWIDEIEKAMAGTNFDTSGTSMDQLGVLLSEMQEKDYQGTIFVGVPGAAKSALAKAVGNEAGVLTIKLDLGDLKGQFVGQSEAKIRHAMKIIEAVGGKGGAFFIATSNDIRSLRPELKRRFKKGTWFFDLPTKEERAKIWELKLAARKMDVAEHMAKLPEDEGWTGAEIETCVDTAWEENISIQEASKGIIPVAMSNHDAIRRLRSEAAGNYLSTSYPGTYVEETKAASVAGPLGRKMKLTE